MGLRAGVGLRVSILPALGGLRLKVLGFLCFPMGPWYDPLPSWKGSELWAPVLRLVHNGAIMVL